MKEKKDTCLNNYTIERCFLNQKKIKDIIEENILNKKLAEGLLTDLQPQIYNNNISM